MSYLHRLRLRIPKSENGPSPTQGTQVFLDDVELKGVQAVALVAPEANGLWLIELKMTAQIDAIDLVDPKTGLD